MEYFLACVIHVLAIVLWIGGAAMVTTALLPALRRFKDVEERVTVFEKVKARFAMQSRITTLLAGNRLCAPGRRIEPRRAKPVVCGLLALSWSIVLLSGASPLLLALLGGLFIGVALFPLSCPTLASR